MNEVRDLSIAIRYLETQNKEKVAKEFDLTRERVGQVVKRLAGVRSLTLDVITFEDMVALNALRLLFGITVNCVAEGSGVGYSWVSCAFVKPAYNNNVKRMSVYNFIMGEIRKRLDVVRVEMDNLSMKANE